MPSESVRKYANTSAASIPLAWNETVMDGKVPRYTYRLQPGITADKHGMIIINNEKIIETIRGEV